MNKTVAQSVPLENLFRPGTGDEPPYLAGREEEQALLHHLLRNLQARRHPPRHAVAFGPRGNGKTALLRVIEQHCRAAGLHTLWLAAPALQSQETFAQAILTESLKQGWKTQGKPLLEGVKNLLQWLQIDLAVGPMQARVRLKDPACRQELQGTTVRELLDIIVSGPEYRTRAPFVLFIDEAHRLAPDLGHELLNDAQIMIGEKLPFLLVLAGTPQLEAHINTLHTTFWERSEILPVGRLAPAATKAALVRPLTEYRVEMDPTGLDQVVAATQGYPYFIQLWGSVLCRRYIAEPGPQITARHVAGAEPIVLERQQYFYGKRYQEPKKQNLQSLACAVAQVVQPGSTCGDSISEEQLEAGLQANTGLELAKIRAGIENLEGLGFLWKPDARMVEPGIPSLMQYTLERHSAAAPDPEPVPDAFKL